MSQWKCRYLETDDPPPGLTYVWQETSGDTTMQFDNLSGGYLVKPTPRETPQRLFDQVREARQSAGDLGLGVA